MLRLCTAILMLILSPGLLLGQSIFRSLNTVSGVIASATVMGGCALQSPTASNNISCDITTGTIAGQSIFVNVNYFDNHALTASASCQSASPTLVVVPSVYPTLWHGIFEDFVYQFNNVNASSDCTVTISDTSTPGSAPWMTAILVGGCSGVCAVDQASSAAVTANTIAATPITTSVPNELLITFCSLKSQSDAIGKSDVPQPMSILQQPVAGVLSGSSVAAAVGSNFTQCLDVNNFSDDAVIDILAVK
jgi:hypothetical protein